MLEWETSRGRAVRRVSHLNSLADRANFKLPANYRGVLSGPGAGRLINASGYQNEHEIRWWGPSAASCSSALTFTLVHGLCGRVDPRKETRRRNRAGVIISGA